MPRRCGNDVHGGEEIEFRPRADCRSLSSHESGQSFARRTDELMANLNLSMINLRLAVFVCVVVIVLGISAVSAAQTVPLTFFDMQMEKGIVTGEPWPVDSFAGTRLWSSGANWNLINTSPGQYDWSMLDAWLAAAKRNNIDVQYTFGETPSWASSKPNDSHCAQHGGAPTGSCDPPNDLNADGTGSNQHWKDFVTAIATRSAGRIHYWEIWDEASNPLRWVGTNAQMLRLASDARTIILGIDPTAVILTPSSGIVDAVELNWWTKYLQAGGGQYADVIAYHGYVQQANHTPVPEDLIKYVTKLKTILKQYGQSGKPLHDTESSWGDGSCCNFTDPDLQAGFTARIVLMHWLVGTQRFYWFVWNDSPAGTLWQADPHDITLPGTLLKPGIAYQQIYEWMAGYSVDQTCTTKGPVWACNLTGSNGYQGQIVWDTSQTCKAGTCTYSNYTFNPMFIQYVTIYGDVIPVNGSTVPIGYQPILLQNMTPAKR